jgi:hypothetical protein
MKEKPFLLEDLKCFELSKTQKSFVLGGTEPKPKTPVDDSTPDPRDDDDGPPPLLQPIGIPPVPPPPPVLNP